MHLICIIIWYWYMYNALYIRSGHFKHMHVCDLQLFWLNFFSLQIVTLTKESSWMWITMKDMALELSRFRFQKQMATKTVYIPSDIAVFNSVFCYVLSLVDSKIYDIDTFRSIHVPFSLWQRLVLKMFLISTCMWSSWNLFFLISFA